LFFGIPLEDLDIAEISSYTDVLKLIEDDHIGDKVFFGG